MANNIQCKSSKFKIPVGIASPKGNDLFVLPNISTNKVFISFNVDDCKSAHLHVFAEDQLDTLIENPLSITISEKREKILELDKTSTLNDFMTPLVSKEVQYYKNLVTHLGCLAGFDFEIIEEGYRYKLDYKISICGISDNILRNSNGDESHAYIDREDKPNQCFLAINNWVSYHPIDVERENTLGYAFLACLGLNNPKYKSIKENKDHRSVLEELSPIEMDCYKKQDSFEKDLKCRKAPSMPTGDDICALIDLYGFSTEESSSCDIIVADFVAKYPKIVELSGSDLPYGEF